MSSAPPALDDRRFVLTLGCPDRPGIIAKITTFIAGFGGSIVEAGYHSVAGASGPEAAARVTMEGPGAPQSNTDPDIGWFFTRQAIKASTVPFGLAELRDRFAGLAAEFGPETEWQLLDSGERRRAVLLVSKDGHCLHDLLGRTVSGELPATIEAVIGNHPDLAEMTAAHGVKFHHVPFPKDPAERGPAFEEVRALVDAHDPHAVVLARFMQVLPPELCEHWAGKAINIHHSFLPSFVGARPYHQAFARGVKLIGATCHYVTPELDAGPIIEQDVIRIDHADEVRDMVRQGRDIERVVLARGLRWHLEGRVLVHGRRTVVFN